MGRSNEEMLSAMSKHADGDPPASSGNLAELRQELARVRAEAEREIAQLREQVVGMQPAVPPRDSRTATERLALEQELTALRRGLADKDRTLDGISLECRRIEDAMEDQHMALDGMRQEVERKTQALAAEQQFAAALARERDELRILLLERRGDGYRGDASRAASVGQSINALAFLGGLALGLVLAVVAGVAMWTQGLLPDTFVFGGHPIPDRSEVNLPGQEGTAPRAMSAPTTGEVDGAAQDGPVRPAIQATVRDRFADGSAGPLLVVISAGSYGMGSRGLTGEADEQPEHQVHIGGFLIGANEATYADYDRFVRATGRRFPDDFGWGRGRRPVVDVSWSDAQAYAQWLSRQTGHRYRLPSEAEWEYAARGGTKSTYWWGHAPESGRALCFDCGTTWDGRSTAPVGSFDPNPFGLYDTAGNVVEWTQDCYHTSYDGAPIDGSAWTSGACAAHVARGGAFNRPAKSMRSAARIQFPPDTRVNMLGFRLVRDE
jgi:formylglycine-generating enzyme required for sulfatase activity